MRVTVRRLVAIAAIACAAFAAAPSAGPSHLAGGTIEIGSSHPAYTVQAGGTIEIGAPTHATPNGGTIEI